MDEEKADAPAPAEPMNNDPPPSYESVVGRIGSVRDKSSGNVDYAKNLIGCVFCGTVCSIIMLIIFLAIPITNIVIGAIYKDDCPAERMIPIYLIVAGSFGILKALGSFFEICHKRSQGVSDEEYERPKVLACIDGPVGCFLFAWFIAGNVWIFRTRNNYQSVTPGLGDYCQETLYLYAFWSTIAAYIFMGVAICVPCLIACIACCVSK